MRKNDYAKHLALVSGIWRVAPKFQCNLSAEKVKITILSSKYRKYRNFQKNIGNEKIYGNICKNIGKYRKYRNP